MCGRVDSGQELEAAWPTSQHKMPGVSTPKTLAEHLAFSRVATLESAADAWLQLVQISGQQTGIGFFLPQSRVVDIKPTNDYPKSDNPNIKGPQIRSQDCFRLHLIQIPLRKPVRAPGNSQDPGGNISSTQSLENGCSMGQYNSIFFPYCPRPARAGKL